MGFVGPLFAVLALLSAHGWGRAGLVALRSPGLTAPVTMVFGVAVIVFLGGLVNLAGIAYGGSLDVIGGAGCLLAVLFTARERPQRPSAASVIAGVVALIPTAFVSATQVPIGLFDFLDDFSKYFAYPVRMLGTGTLAGGGLNSLGTETLGGQALLDGFLLAHAPLTTINAVDAVFGLALCGLLLAGQIRRWGWSWLPLLGGVLLLAVVPNQYVNISTLYLGVALLAAAIVLLAEGGERALVLGAILGTLIVLKVSFAVAAALAAILGLAATLPALGLRAALRPGWCGPQSAAASCCCRGWGYSVAICGPRCREARISRNRR